LKAPILSPFKGLVLALFVVATIVTVASFLYVLLMGYGFVFFTSEGIAISSRSFLAYVLLLFWLGFFVPIEAGTVFLSVWIVYVLCFVAAWKWRESFHKAFRELISNPFHGVFNNFLLILPLVSSMLLMAVTGMIELQASVGIPTGEPEFGNLPLQGIFLELAYAPVVEELGFRFIPIGLYAALYLLLAGTQQLKEDFSSPQCFIRMAQRRLLACQM